jgi:endogenous inhibitor of DNA gyrase (YacG/DUF329 family)
MWLETLCKPTSDEAQCPTCGGPVCRRIYGEMYAGSFVQDGQRVEIRKQPASGFADPIQLDPITAYFDGGLYRIWPSDRYFSRGGKKLHRAVWMAAFGPVPEGCHIHHRDGNALNNQVANLECMPATDHANLEHAGQRKQHFNQLARERASAWHKSEAGLLWHKRHAARQQFWTKNKREARPCPICGKEFMALIRKSATSQRYCSNACKVAAYRKRK